MEISEKKARIRELWQLCFHDDEQFVDLLFGHLYRDENALCFEERGVLTSALQMLPYRMTYGESVLEVSYISGAATRPEYRNRGLMGRLLRESFETMRSRAIPLSALIPAEPWLYGYYATKGYAPVFFGARVTSRPCIVSRVPGIGGWLRRSIGFTPFSMPRCAAGLAACCMRGTTLR